MLEFDRRNALFAHMNTTTEKHGNKRVPVADLKFEMRIGNAVPPPAAQAIAGEMGRTLLLAWSGETFQLSSTPVWVRPIAVALRTAA